MEFNLSALFATVGIHILDFNNFWDIFDDLNNAVDFINFNIVNKLLLEEFVEPDVHLVSELWIFLHKFLHLDCKHVN